jgi:hypothetical protein
MKSYYLLCVMLCFLTLHGSTCQEISLVTLLHEPQITYTVYSRI